MSRNQQPKDTHRADPESVERNAVDSAVVEGEVIDRPGTSYSSRMIARWMDDIVRIPGTDIGIGLDGILGFIPGVGDASTTAIAGVILFDSVRNRVPLPVLARMGLNLGVDALLGYLPVVGDVADFAHRANRKNMRLLDQVIADREQTRQSSVIYLVVAIGMVLLTVLALIAAVVFGFWALWQLLFN